jgi:hypothetical protein
MNQLSKYRVSLLAILLAVLSLAPAARAQAQETIARVNVPFAFECGNQHYPAGTYDLRTLSNNVLWIRGASSSGLAMMRMDMNMLPKKTGKAVFGVSGNEHFLHEIWSPRSTTHVFFQASKAEKRVKLASNSISQPDIQLALLDVPR